MPGIYIIKGMKISISSFDIKLDEEGNNSSSIMLELSYDAFIAWALIALEHRQRAIDAMAVRKEIWADTSADEQAKSSAIFNEFTSSMQAIVATAVCLDSFYDQIRPFSAISDATKAAWSGKKTARFTQVGEAIRTAYKVSNAQYPAYRDYLKVLYKLRDAAVHPSSSPHAPQLYPDLNIATDWRFGTFRGDMADIIVCNGIGSIWDLSQAEHIKAKPLAAFNNSLRSALSQLLPDGRPTSATQHASGTLAPKKQKTTPASTS